MLHATIMAGGAGTRFWPASRTALPKQLLNLTGDRSMIQATADRMAGLCPAENLMIVTNQSLVDAIAAQLPDVPRASIIGEPAKRDTAPCIGLAASLTFARDPDATMVVLPADHVIGPTAEFQRSLEHAADLVDQDPERIVTFGIRPTYPAEAFGYIERGAEPFSSQGLPSYPVARFREKPDAETARQFLQAGTFYWNSGIFVWKARTILKAIEQFVPRMYQHLAAIADTIGTDRFDATLEKEFSAIEGTSIDYAVMERYSNVAVVEARFDWDDLGNWSSLPRLRGVDESGNCIDGRHLGVDTGNTIVRTSDGHLVVTLGIQDCIVVHTPDATLVANRADEAKIKQVVAELTERGWEQYL